jgi:hypothetical protein
VVGNSDQDWGFLENELKAGECEGAGDFSLLGADSRESRGSSEAAGLCWLGPLVIDPGCLNHLSTAKVSHIGR